ncbi:hypothetical protein BDV06DRAFT_122653 [Aspergillus oleicola]
MSEPTATTSRKPRRFLPEPIETTSRSSKQHQTNQVAKRDVHQAHASRLSELEPSPPPERETPGSSHTPQPWQTDRQHGTARDDDATGPLPPDMMHTQSTGTARNMGATQQHNSRRFAPQLMETASHSFRPGAEPVNQDSQAWPQTQMVGNAVETSESFEVSPEIMQESRFSYSSLLRRQETRRHSFRVPDLPAIPSSGSEDSEPITSRPSGSPSAAGSDSHLIDRQTSKGDQETSILEYILPFPLHPSENQLKERALEAFPNEQVYQPVDHFAIDKEDEDHPYGEGSNVRTRPESWINRRTSSADLPSELEYLRRYKEEAGMNRRHYLTTKGGRFSHTARRASRNADKVVNRDEGWDSAPPFTQLTPATSPPMLGGDLVFPQSLTPEATICEGSRAAGFDQSESTFSSLAGLWRGSPRFSAHNDRGGLWKGTCKPDRHSLHRSEALVSGLIPPRHDVEEDPRTYSGEPLQNGDPCRQSAHLTVPSSMEDLGHGGYTDQELSDDFVTQIYDYLSLGYPSVARYYDYELSKVSGLPVAALRADDLNTDAKGHVGVQDITERGAVNKVCMRWTALRLYIEEWVRYHPQMLEADCYHEGWGVRERKGSWAF